MAENSDANSIEQELACCVCFELLADPHTPKQLDCPDIICEICLNRLVIDNVIDCPKCHEMTRVPTGGVAALKTDLCLRNLAEIHQQYLKDQKQQKQPQEKLHSVTCNDEHHVCPGHKSEKRDFFCVSCGVMVCQACFKMNHSECTGHYVKEEHKDSMDELNEKLNMIELNADKCEKISHELGGAEERFLSCIETEEEKIDQAVALAVASAYEQGDALKAEIKAKHNHKLTECQRQKTILQKQAHALQGVVADVTVAMLGSSHHDLIGRHMALNRKLNIAHRCKYTGHVLYLPDEVEFKAEISVTLGKIEVKETGQTITNKSN